MNKENKPGRWIPGVGQSEQEQASGSTAEPDNRQTTGPAETNPEEAGREKNPARGKESKRWDFNQRCLVVETEQDLELGSLSTVMIELPEGRICIVGTDEVKKPELIVTERVFADSEPEARDFYEKNGSGVDVKVGSDSLLVTGKSSPSVVSGRSGNIRTGNISGSGITIRGLGNIRTGNISGSGIAIGGGQIGPSQSVPTKETQVVLRVPVAKNANNEGEKPESTYIIKTSSGDIRVEKGTGKYNISSNSGNVIIRACNIVDLSKIENAFGDIEVTGTTLGSSEIENAFGNIGVIGTTLGSSTITNGSGNIEVTGAKLNSCSIADKTGNIAVVGTTLNSCAITNGSGNIEVTGGRFIGENTVKTEIGDILVEFGGNQGEIEVQTSSGGGAIQETIFFEGVENPNGQTAILRLTAKAGKIEVNE